MRKQKLLVYVVSFNDEIDKNSFYDQLKGCLNNYYENRYELRNQPEAVNEKSNDMIGKLQHMFGI